MSIPYRNEKLRCPAGESLTGKGFYAVIGKGVLENSAEKSIRMIEVLSK
jgi:hypothetical protein